MMTLIGILTRWVHFWTVNNDDPYWDSHEMGTGDAWSDAEVKKAPAKELDWSSWFN